MGRKQVRNNKRREQINQREKTRKGKRKKEFNGKEKEGI